MADNPEFGAMLKQPSTANASQDMHAAANGAPKIVRSAATGSPLAAPEPNEFPFNALPTDNIETTDHAIRVPKPSSTTSNGSAAHYYPPFAPISRIPTAEGEQSEGPRERKSVQFARSGTHGSEPPAATSRQQSWEVDDAEGRKDKQTSSLMGTHAEPQPHSERKYGCLGWLPFWAFVTGQRARRDAFRCSR
jgi:phospholipase D1/2